jgi:ABC-2 type transport system ATP-binding protein
MSEPVLVVQNLRKKFGDFEAVRGVSFSVARGEVFGLLGPNGAGKTTTISMATGLYPPTEGQIRIGGVDLSEDANAAKRKVGLVPQELALYPTLSARENLMFFGRIYGLKGKQLREKVQSMLEMVRLADRADDAVEKYSGGMKRRVNIAAGLLHEPEILFLDEPTVGVDPQSRNAIFESVETLNRQGMSIVYTTHYMEEAERLCHRVAIVDMGEIIAMDTPSGLIQSLGGGVIQVGLDDGSGQPLGTSDREEEGGRIPHVVEQLGLLPSIKAVSLIDGRLKVEAHRAQEALMSVLDLTNKLDIRVTMLEILEPNLEGVFLHLTGKKLRE